MQKQIDQKKLNRSFKNKKTKIDKKDDTSFVPSFLSKSVDSARNNLTKEVMH